MKSIRSQNQLALTPNPTTFWFCDLKPQFSLLENWGDNKFPPLAVMKIKLDIALCL